MAPKNKPNAFKNQFKYNGMEAQGELDLGLYDYGARMYLPDIGRWEVLAPLAEKDYGWSPYKYAYNNPLLFLDPDGKGEVYGMSTDQLKETGSVSTTFSATPDFFFEGKKYHGQESLENAKLLAFVRDVSAGIIKPGKNTYHFSSNASSTVRLNGMVYRTYAYENMTNVEFTLDGILYQPNSLRTLYGRDVNERNSRIGNFSGVTNISDDDIAHLLGYSQYLFYHRYKNLLIEDVARQQSAKGALDFKNVAYRLLEIGRNELLKINGTVYNANEAGNYLWGMVLDFHGIFISPNYAADRVTRNTAGRPDEPWEQRAISQGRSYGRMLRANPSSDLINRINGFRTQYGRGHRP